MAKCKALMGSAVKELTLLQSPVQVYGNMSTVTWDFYCSNFGKMLAMPITHTDIR